MKLRVGIVGLGPAWANRHVPALRALPTRFRVSAVCDPVAHRAELAAAEFGARQVDSFRALAAAEDVDALMLLSARWYGALPIHAACEAGKAVYCAASIDLAAKEATELRDRVRSAGIAFMAELPNRLAPATIRLKELIATRLGQPRMIFCNQRHAAGGGHNGSADIDTRRLIEMVDWSCYVVGRQPTSVVGASCPSEPGGTVDYSLMMLDFAQPGGPGAQAQIACGSYVPRAWGEAASFRRPADMQVVCERGIAFVDLPAGLVWFDGAGQHLEALDHERPVGEQLLMQFHRMVGSLVLNTTNLEDAYRAVSIVLAARKSSLDGRRVALPS
ncbi:Inositol 2-dehydrogenase [Pirellulimonas nuda]|uniref:Inositol 2-dehydrogenase n=1 Tax=Pirellulimonas nuda TaxID=2528009 RepID=A0A518DB51_9BACT|nr:Gfo/Idh/MocA family oxidoreductase [Pirellulimonas nuda]QDU88709.1 Inositol 2-dehydrogenase [Pirellulimonas nuda]